MSRNNALLLGLLCILSLGAKVERVGDETAVVAASLPGDVDEVAKSLRSPAIQASLKKGLVAEHLYGFSPMGPYTLKIDNIGGEQPAEDKTNNPAMERYRALSPDQTRYDLYLDNLDASFWWESEYRLAGKPVPFTCSFVLHLESDGPGRTRIEVLEFQPRVKVGRQLGVEAHGIFPRFQDKLQAVPPTTRDRVELLERIQSVIANSK